MRQQTIYICEPKVQKTTCNQNKKDLLLSVELFEFITERNDCSRKVLSDFVFNHSSTKNLLQKIDYQFNFDIFLTSITHSSLINEFPELKLESNQRLEYLGDAVIDLLIAALLIKTYPHFQEGKLSKLRSALVNELSLALLSNILGLSRVILLGKGELCTKGYLKSSVLSDAFESLLGGIFADSGFLGVQKVFTTILNLYQEQFKKDFISDEALDEFDPKSRLQELTVSLGKGLPQYQNIEMEDKQYRIDLMIDNKIILTRTGAAKKQIERELAYQVLKKRLYLEGDNHVIKTSAPK